jgi:hypothetical protein
VTQEPSQDAPPRAAEQNGGRVESCRRCSQDGDNRIQNGNARQQFMGAAIRGIDVGERSLFGAVTEMDT